MSTIPLMNSQEKQVVRHTEIPYIMSGVIDVYESLAQSVGIVLIHDARNEEIDLENSIKDYLSFGVNKLFLLHKDGTKFSDDISYKFPNVVAISHHEDIEEQKNIGFSLGHLINIAIEKINTDIVFTSWTSVNPFGMSSWLLNQKMSDFPLCVMPVFENEYGKIASYSVRPKSFFFKNKISYHDNQLYPYSLFPYEGVGLFNIKKFIEIGGFDANLRDLFWQMYEFGIRAYTNDMNVRLSPYYRVRVTSDIVHLMKNDNKEYHLVCLKARIGIRFLHVLKFFFINITAPKIGISRIKVFLHKEYSYQNTLKSKMKEFWT